MPKMPKMPNIYDPKDFFFIELLILVFLILIVYKWPPFIRKHVTDNYPVLIHLFWLTVMFLMVISFIFVKQKAAGLFTHQNFRILIGIASAIGGLVYGVAAVILFMIWGIFKFPRLLKGLLTVILVLMAIGAVAFVYLSFNDIFKMPQNRYVRVFINLVLYLPCILIDIIEYFKHQWNITTKTIWIILGLEILLLTLYILIPYLFQKIIKASTKNATLLLRDPVYLNKEKTLGSFKEDLVLDNTDVNPNYRYSVSAWFYINPQPPNTSKAYTKYTNILNYGNKPQIQFNSLENTLRIQTELNVTPGTDKKFVTIYSTKDIDYQKWHNIVINYDRGTMDIFIDGELVSSRPKIIPYMAHETITIGAKNGIHGGICNVVYYDDLLSKSNIVLSYKLLRYRKFPVV